MKNSMSRARKKLTTEAKKLLIALTPQFHEEEFALEYCDYAQTDVWEHWSSSTNENGTEWDSKDAMICLMERFEDETRDWKGFFKASEENGYENFDVEPFRSPYRNLTAAEVISHCRKLAKAGVRWK